MAEKNADLRVQRTFHMLKNAFTQLLEEKVYEEITINEICDRAFIRRTTFYRHFTDKDNYFRFYVSDLMNDFLKEYELKTATIDIPTYCMSMCEELSHFMQQHQGIIHVMRQSSNSGYYQIYDILIAEVQKNFDTFLKQNDLVLPGGLPARLVSVYYTSAILGVLHYIYQNQSLSEDQSEWLNAISLLLSFAK